MSKKIPSRSQVLFALKEIEKEVVRVLGKQQENIITIRDFAMLIGSSRMSRKILWTLLMAQQ